MELILSWFIWGFVWHHRHSSCMFSLFDSGQWQVFSGNELGALLGWWMFRCWKQQNPEADAVKNLYMLSSTVSSKILRAIAVKEGFHFEVTQSSLVLTDFLLYHLLLFLKNLPYNTLGHSSNYFVKSRIYNVWKCWLHTHLHRCLDRKHWQDSSGWETEPRSFWTRAKVFSLLLKRP